MYVPDPPFIPPTNSNIRIWRYVDFAKFCSMLDSSTLYFTRLDQMEDEYEGAFSEASFDTVVGLFPDPVQNELLEQQLNERRRMEMNFVRDVHRQATFVNCWHMNEGESAAMWKIYSGLGIAIQSTFQRFADSFAQSAELIYIGEIGYKDYTQFPMTYFEDNWIEPTMFKRAMFEYEREIRAYWLNPPMTNGVIDLNRQDQPSGRPIPIDLRTLIERVYISPGRRRWFRRLVRNVLNKYGFDDIPVVSSLLDDYPHTQSWKDAGSSTEDPDRPM